MPASTTDVEPNLDATVPYRAFYEENLPVITESGVDQNAGHRYYQLIYRYFCSKNPPVEIALKTFAEKMSQFLQMNDIRGNVKVASLRQDRDFVLSTFTDREGHKDPKQFVFNVLRKEMLGHRHEARRPKLTPFQFKKAIEFLEAGEISEPTEP